MLPNEGEEPLDEETKQQFARRIRFEKMTRMFYAPDEAAEYAKKALIKEEKPQLPTPVSADEKKIDLK